MNKAFIKGFIYDVLTREEFGQCIHNGIYVDIAKTLIVVTDPVDFTKYIVPIFNKVYDPYMVGFYIGYNDGLVFTRYPETPEEKETFSIEHLANFCSAKDLGDIVAEQEKLNSDEMRYLVAEKDNVFKPIIDPVNDTPLMRGFKQAVIDKEIDINRYQSRFGPDFNNDKRKFNGNKISIDKFISIGKNLDMKATLIIEDKNKNVPNPMKTKIVVDLMEDDDND